MDPFPACICPLLSFCRFAGSPVYYITLCLFVPVCISDAFYAFFVLFFIHLALFPSLLSYLLCVICPLNVFRPFYPTFWSCSFSDLSRFAANYLWLVCALWYSYMSLFLFMLLGHLGHLGCYLFCNCYRLCKVDFPFIDRSSDYDTLYRDS